MPTSTLGVIATPPTFGLLRHPYRVLLDGIETCDSLLTVYEHDRGSNTKGVATHVQQDVLRAMLVLAGATLDACLGLGVKAALPVLYRFHPGCSKSVKRLIGDRLDASRKGTDTSSQFPSIAHGDIVNALFAESLETLLRTLANQLGSKGLQDEQSVKRVLELCGIDHKPFWNSDVAGALEARNKIIHELDARPEAPTAPGQRTRTPRKRRDMEKSARVLLQLTDSLLTHIDGVLRAAGAPNP